MPHSKGIPAYCLHKPTGQARVRIDGKDHYLGPHGSEESKQAYERIVRKLITDRAAAEVRARVEIATDLTVNELILGYLLSGCPLGHGRLGPLPVLCLPFKHCPSGRRAIRAARWHPRFPLFSH